MVILFCKVQFKDLVKQLSQDLTLYNVSDLGQASGAPFRMQRKFSRRSFVIRELRPKYNVHKTRGPHGFWDRGVIIYVFLIIQITKGYQPLNYSPSTIFDV